MGSKTAEAAANNLGLVEGLRIHLRANHYPPIPLTFVEVAIMAIERFHAGAKFSELIQLPEGASWGEGRTDITVGEAIKKMKLKPWLKK